MDSKQRVELIRAGNELFNKGEIERAEEIFVKTSYRDGITRIADYYFFDKRQPLVALKYYKMVKRDDKVNEIYERMKFALARLLGTEPQEQEIRMPKVSPKLKILAEEIIRDSENQKN